MSIYQYRPGVHNASSYMASGTPFVTGSDSLSGVMKIEFPRVTKLVTFHIDSAGSNDLYFYFNENATNLNKFHLEKTGSHPSSAQFDVKCKEIYVSGSGLQFRIFASLTGINSEEMFTLTGSGITE
jgi:hypothetical protein